MNCNGIENENSQTDADRSKVNRAVQMTFSHAHNEHMLHVRALHLCAASTKRNSGRFGK